MILKGYANTPAGQIHYRRLVGAGPTVVFLHQTASSSRMWTRVMSQLEGVCDCVAMDTPGFGGSFEPSELPDSMGVYAGWLLEAIHALNIDTFHAFGHHTGTCIGVEMARIAPARVSSLAMIGPVPLTADERQEFSRHFSTAMKPDVEGQYLKTTWDYLRGLGAHASLELHHRELLDTTRAYMGRYMAYTNVWRQDFTAIFKDVIVPMLLMCAPDDVLWPYFRRACEMRPDARSVTLSGANFEPDLDSETIARSYRTFLGEHHFLQS